MRVFRSPLLVSGTIVAVVGLFIAVLSAVEWRWQHNADSSLRDGGTAITGTVFIVKNINRDREPAVVRVKYTFQGEREAEVDVSSSPDREKLVKGAPVDLLVAADEPSSPRLVDAVDGGDAEYWRNSTFGGVVLAIAGLSLLLISVLRNRRYGH